jgi:hypothetical protein
MDITDAANKVYMRWGITARPVLTSKADVGRLLAISIGLGALFHEDRQAEMQWIKRTHPALRASPYHLILQGRFDEVLVVVNRERNL